MSSSSPAHDSRDVRAWFERGSPVAGGGPRRRVEIWPDGALIVARDMVDVPHQGFHASIKIGLVGGFEVRCKARPEPDRVSAVLINSNVEHSTDARGSLVADLLIDPESDEYARIAHWFGSPNGVCALPGRVVEPLRRELLARLSAGDSFIAIWETVFAQLADGGRQPRHWDSRVAKTADFLKQNFVSPPSVAELAARVNLSVSRLVHLFTQRMGVPLRTYVHWLRMRDVLYAIAGGESLTIAAHRAGFSDLSHLTRKFRDMFGEPPSKLIGPGADGSLHFVHRVHDHSPHSATDAPRIVELLKGATLKSVRV
jgi:AraC-like DNA-binding protein